MTIFEPKTIRKPIITNKPKELIHLNSIFDDLPSSIKRNIEDKVSQVSYDGMSTKLTKNNKINNDLSIGVYKPIESGTNFGVMVKKSTDFTNTFYTNKHEVNFKKDRDTFVIGSSIYKNVNRYVKEKVYTYSFKNLKDGVRSPLFVPYLDQFLLVLEPLNNDQSDNPPLIDEDEGDDGSGDVIPEVHAHNQAKLREFTQSQSDEDFEIENDVGFKMLFTTPNGGEASITTLKGEPLKEEVQSFSEVEDDQTTEYIPEIMQEAVIEAFLTKYKNAGSKLSIDDYFKDELTTSTINKIQYFIDNGRLYGTDEFQTSDDLADYDYPDLHSDLALVPTDLLIAENLDMEIVEKFDETSVTKIYDIIPDVIHLPAPEKELPKTNNDINNVDPLKYNEDFIRAAMMGDVTIIPNRIVEEINNDEDNLIFVHIGEVGEVYENTHEAGLDHHERHLMYRELTTYENKYFDMPFFSRYGEFEDYAIKPISQKELRLIRSQLYDESKWELEVREGDWIDDISNPEPFLTQQSLSEIMEQNAMDTFANYEKTSKITMESIKFVSITQPRTKSSEKKFRVKKLIDQLEDSENNSKNNIHNLQAHYKRIGNEVDSKIFVAETKSRKLDFNSYEHIYDPIESVPDSIRQQLKFIGRQIDLEDRIDMYKFKNSKNIHGIIMANIDKLWYTIRNQNNKAKNVAIDLKDSYSNSAEPNTLFNYVNNIDNDWLVVGQYKYPSRFIKPYIRGKENKHGLFIAKEVTTENGDVNLYIPYGDVTMTVTGTPKFNVTRR